MIGLLSADRSQSASRPLTAASCPAPSLHRPRTPSMRASGSTDDSWKAIGCSAPATVASTSGIEVRHRWRHLRTSDSMRSLRSIRRSPSAARRFVVATSRSTLSGLTPEGKPLHTGSSEAWGQAAIAVGTDPEVARAAARRTTAFYTGEPPA